MMPQIAPQFISVCKKLKFSLLSYFSSQVLNTGAKPGSGVTAKIVHPKRGGFQEKTGHLGGEVFSPLSTGTKVIHHFGYQGIRYMLLKEEV